MSCVVWWRHLAAENRTRRWIKSDSVVASNENIEEGERERKRKRKKKRRRQKAKRCSFARARRKGRTFTNEPIFNYAPPTIVITIKPGKKDSRRNALSQQTSGAGNLTNLLAKVTSFTGFLFVSWQPNQVRPTSLTCSIVSS